MAESNLTLKEALSRRYPGVRIVDVDMSRTVDGLLQQNVRYQAPIEVLKSLGLLTPEMLEGMRSKSPLRNSMTSFGDGFFFSGGHHDAAATAGHCDLFMFTGAAPRERARFSLRLAQRELRRIGKRVAAEVRHG